MAQTQTNRPKITLTSDQAEISSSHDFQATVLIENGTSLMHWNAHLATVSSLVLEIQDKNGEVVPHFPPPVPDASYLEEGARVMQAGASESIRLEGLSVDDGFLENGKLKVRFVLPCAFSETEKSDQSETTMTSNWLTLQVSK